MAGGLGTAAGLALGAAGTLEGQYCINRKRVNELIRITPVLKREELAKMLKSIQGQEVSEANKISGLTTLSQSKTKEYEDFVEQDRTLAGEIATYSVRGSEETVKNENLRKEVQKQDARLQIVEPSITRFMEIMSTYLKPDPTAEKD